ncbi:MAG: ROK family protein [Pseudomonadota bacterium]|nr:ROK family protein [Pseudomonadota bacterium]
MKQPMRLFGAMEAGGTKFICAIGDRGGRILDESRIETRDPASTLMEACRYFRTAADRWGALTALGVGAFGPLDLRPRSATFGYITSTPKPGWKNVDLVGFLKRAIDRPVYIDTDVNGAALGELRWGAGQGLESLAYVTVGTGIGVGIVHHGRAVHGLMHPELGHIFVRRHPADSGFVGICPFHGDCLEGLACGAAIVARTGRALKDAPPADPIWTIEADYLGQLCAVLVLSHSPQRILIGGGVMQTRLFAEVHERMLHWLHDYLGNEELRSSHYITPPGLGVSAGIKGALSLAIDSGQ